MANEEQKESTAAAGLTRSTGPYRLQAAGMSDRGLKRGHNEDSLSVVPDLGLFIVADGMGGHNAGEVASRQAIESMVDLVRRVSRKGSSELPAIDQPGLSENEQTLVAAVKIANRDVCNLALEHQEYSGMGTTLVAILLTPDGQTVSVAHVGDSRCYRLREGKLDQLTLDHSWVSEQLQKNIITEEEAKNHRWKNVITRALGNKLDVEVDVQSCPLQPNDVFLLCSDGLSGMVEDGELEKALVDHPDLEECVQVLIRKANSAGGLDNISLIVLRFLEDDAAEE